MSPYQVIVGPLVTEKAEEGRVHEQTLCFRVHPKATKTDVKNAVHAIFQVQVDRVRTARYVGKMRRQGRYRGRRPNWKKAYVKLKEGEKTVEYTQI
jgi:large subunit ribosomal protein L23